jgi:hypothetical protein
LTIGRSSDCDVFIDETKADSMQTAKIHKSWIPGVYYTEK